ncbi:PilZ domain-containing protein [Pseudomonas sp. TTU2014-080ASC]|uniref:PilZ domain-containing protein n=1 Tax=Pseudomonas sp. TTU2014-080ASC TaxID=1729724 RepID=UPI000718A295|nr:PilZ domain-containing protein [Pseudomonas sp. TTU2014-080ASC]KRW62160.1 pilus assembly protein PilZ [Pseudomonas sp. TTU2014-080ASC]
MPMQEDIDRREYYRIDDTIALEFTQLTGPEAVASDELHDSSPLFNLLSDLQLMDIESQHLLRNISERDRTLANYLKLTNKRIELLGQALSQSLLRDIGPAREVSISEGGINFLHNTPVEQNSHLALKMILMPQALGLLLRARVVHCRAVANEKFELGLEFESLTEAQRQTLARHILQRQAQKRREALKQPK